MSLNYKITINANLIFRLELACDTVLDVDGFDDTNIRAAIQNLFESMSPNVFSYLKKRPSSQTDQTDQTGLCEKWGQENEKKPNSVEVEHVEAKRDWSITEDTYFDNIVLVAKDEVDLPLHINLITEGCFTAQRMAKDNPDNFKLSQNRLNFIFSFIVDGPKTLGQSIIQTLDKVKSQNALPTPINDNLS